MDESHLALYASRLGVDLWQEYSAVDAAKLMRVGVGAIRSAKNKNELPHIMVGSKRYTILGLDLVRWKMGKRIQSESTTSQKTAVETGVEHGMTKKPSSEDQAASALRILKRQSAH